MLGLTTTRRLRAELDAIRSYNDALRERCEAAEKNEATERMARRTITRQHAELDAANRRLEGRVLELGNRISALTEADPAYAAELERQLADAREALAEEAKRADRLQARLDDACGLNDPAVLAGSGWQTTRHDKKTRAAS